MGEKSELNQLVKKLRVLHHLIHCLREEMALLVRVRRVIELEQVSGRREGAKIDS